MQRLSAAEQNGMGCGGNGGIGGGGGCGPMATSMGGESNSHEHNPNVVPDNRGNLHITVKKTKPILGIAIEGGANTKHPLPRIINIHVSVILRGGCGGWQALFF